MKRYLLVLLVLLAWPWLAARADNQSVTFYLQLICGTDDDQAPAPDARPAGAEVTRRLQAFKWNYYWEISRRAVVVDPGGKTRKRMSARHEVEIALTTPGEMTIRIYADGKLSRRKTQPSETPFFIAGGDKEEAQAWFIVVRRDNPPPPPPDSD